MMSRTPSPASAPRGRASPSSADGGPVDPRGSGADAVPVTLARVAARGALAVIGLLDASVVLGHGGLRRSSGFVRGAESTDRHALAKAALVALLLAAPGRAQDSASKGDDVLGWLSGDSQPGQVDPTPATPPTTQQPTEVAPPVPAAPDAPDAAPAAASRPASAATAASQAFADLLKQAMTLEVQVEDYENSTLGAEEHPETLQAYKKQRWERIQKDKA